MYFIIKNNILNTQISGLENNLEAIGVTIEFHKLTILTLFQIRNP